MHFTPVLRFGLFSSACSLEGQACLDCQCILESNHRASVSQQALKIKCNGTMEVWVWENGPPHQVASQTQLLAAETEGRPAGSERGHVTARLWESVRKESLSGLRSHA